MWADPVYDVVGSFTSVTMDDRAVCQDLFLNAVMAAVVEVWSLGMPDVFRIAYCVLPLRGGQEDAGGHLD
ncbi:MAG: hypothetical protein ISS56_18690 [Anaerolineae bacterium]|nr:hypothetical protein [Anaerolineae bacterium]